MFQHIKKDDLFILTTLSLALFLYHILTSAWSGYGFFIDEFYYVACSKRLAFGYVDHPPLTILLLAMSRSILGDSIAAIRFLPSLGISATVFMVGLIVRQLGGSRTAVILAALAVIAMTVYELMGSFYSMNAFEPLIWSVVVFFVIRIVQSENTKYWLA
jgi:dolichyl-phosphate-mannose--protein O-mannosyl transferase